MFLRAKPFGVALGIRSHTASFLEILSAGQLLYFTKKERPQMSIFRSFILAGSSFLVQFLGHAFRMRPNFGYGEFSSAIFEENRPF